MTYDRDLDWARTAARGFFALNVAAAGWNAFAGNLATAGACLIWAGNCCAWLGQIRAQQRTRDQGMILESAVIGLLSGKVDLDNER